MVAIKVSEDTAKAAVYLEREPLFAEWLIGLCEMKQRYGYIESMVICKEGKMSGAKLNIPFFVRED